MYKSGIQLGIFIQDNQSFTYDSEAGYFDLLRKPQHPKAQIFLMMP